VRPANITASRCGFPSHDGLCDAALLVMKARGRASREIAMRRLILPAPGRFAGLFAVSFLGKSTRPFEGPRRIRGVGCRFVVGSGFTRSSWLDVAQSAGWQGRVHFAAGAIPHVSGQSAVGANANRDADAASGSGPGPRRVGSGGREGSTEPRWL